MKFILKTIFWLFIFLNTPLFASIDNTKHNLSTTSTGTIKAQSETEICVFCHIPHRANVDGKPLWNRSMPTSTYTMYNSDYLKRMGYAVENDLGTTNNTPGALSRQCLSCHDGTVAVGAVSVLHTLTDQTIAMAGVEADGTMPSTATGYIGTDLTMHHPVGIIYNPAPTKIFDDGTTRTMELKVSPDSPIRIFNYAGNNYVECSSCHDPHKDNDKFLRVDTGANLAQNVAATCTACHEKIDWVGSVHQSPPVGSPDYTDATLIANYGTAKIADISCSNCHMPHNAGGTPYLNRQVHEQTCFQGASSTTVGAACHGDNIGTAVDIESELKKNYAHPVISALYPGTGNHTNLDTLYGTGIVDPNGGGGIDWANNKHTSCMDCHNPHKSKPTTRVSNNPLDPNYWYPTTPTNLTSASGVLAGVTGVEPSWPTEWFQPNIFQTTEAATKEYQICFKCHSYWGIGDTINGISSTHFTPSSNYTVPMTDVAWSMNINNKSGHPVVISQSLRPGSYAPKEANSLLPPWSNHLGTATMYCSDCHGAEDKLGGDPKGPHGSNLKYLLTGENQSWPIAPRGWAYHTLDIGTAGSNDLFCKNCHDLTTPHKDWGNLMDLFNFDCITCHVAIPHGSPVSRLIGYETFPSPYNYEGNSLKINRYIKNTIIDENDIDAGPGCNNVSSCHGGNTVPGYDPNIMP